MLGRLDRWWKAVGIVALGALLPTSLVRESWAADARAAPSGDQDFTLKVGDLDRRYSVHVPRGYDGKRPMPVVVMLHGGGGTSRAAAFETGWAVKADDAGFLAVFPNAMPPDPTKVASFARNPQLWNDGSDRFYQGQNKVDDVGFLNAMLDDLFARFTLDARRGYVTGFSNGASMAFRFGGEASKRIAAIAPVAGACWLDSLKLDRPVPMCYITGTADPLNLIEGGVPRLATGASDKVRAATARRSCTSRWKDSATRGRAARACCRNTSLERQATNWTPASRFGTSFLGTRFPFTRRASPPSERA